MMMQVCVGNDYVSDSLTKSSDRTPLHQHACLEWHVAMTDWWVIISCNFKGPFTGPLNPVKTMFHGGRRVFQVDQAPSGPTVIRPLVRPIRHTPKTQSHFYRCEIFGFGRLTGRRTGRAVCCLGNYKPTICCCFLTAENNFRRVGISDLQKSQVTSLGKTKFDSLEFLRGGEWVFFQRRADLNSATPMSRSNRSAI